MPFNSPDIETFKQNLDSTIVAVQKHKTESHAAIKIQSMLNVTVYVLATRFTEATIKHIIYNCCKMRGDNQAAIQPHIDRLKGFNNPEFKKVREVFQECLNFDITNGQTAGRFGQTDITFMNEIVLNRHRNVHASFDSSEWYNQNKKDLSNFTQEYTGLLKILEYLDSIVFDPATNTFRD